jgi:outer membrane cobalamin receptor
LINNKRLSGKANDINSTLQRISASQVERVEIIRGASSVGHVQSQGLVVNIIMNEDEATSSTFWRVGGRLSEGHLFSPDLQVSHNATRGKFDYIISVEAKQGHHIEHRLDEVFTPEMVKTADTERNADSLRKYLRFNGNLIYNAE